jgi:hypothetical protein
LSSGTAILIYMMRGHQGLSSSWGGGLVGRVRGGVGGMVSWRKGGRGDGLSLELMFWMKDGGVWVSWFLWKGRTSVESVVSSHVSWEPHPLHHSNLLLVRGLTEPLSEPRGRGTVTHRVLLRPFVHELVRHSAGGYPTTEIWTASA